MKLLHATTVPSTLHFLKGQTAGLVEQGFEVFLLSSPVADLYEFARSEGVPAIPLEMNRSISPRADVVTLFRLVRILRTVRPEILHAHTPKAGLLATVAGRITGVPICIYQIHGLRYMTATGPRRLLLKTTERIACLLAHRVLCVSPSVLAYAEDEHIIRRGKGSVIGSGTINGVDVEAFDPALFQHGSVEARKDLGIPTDSPIVGFIGRLAADKGLAELATAWQSIHAFAPGAHLLVIGDPEDNDPVDPRMIEILSQDPHVHMIGFRSDVRPLIAAMSMLVLPSHREGFGQTLLEASAMGVATVGSDIPGVSDAIVDGKTGLLFPVGDADALADRIRTLLQEPELRAELGRAGRRRALAEFDQRDVREKLLEYYMEAALAQGLSIPGRGPAAAGLGTSSSVRIGPGKMPEERRTR